MGSTQSAGALLKNNSYRIQRLLGQGGFGAVYLAEDLMLNRPCAVKESFDTSPGAQAQFELEARILAYLNHAHLPRVTDNFIAPSGQQYLVMEYVEGQDLDTLLKQRGPLSEKDVLAWMDQVLDAVAYLHAYQPPVIHRDIKPENLLLLPDGATVKLVDFGIAKIGGTGNKTRDAARAVTAGFSPPEQYGAGTDTYSDVYALGATFYNLLTNVVPPVSIDIAHSGARLIEPRRLNPQISPQTEQVILTAMQLDPKLRFPDAGAMRQALQGKLPATIQATCPHCGQTVRAGSKFCASCGQALASVPPFRFQKSGFEARTVQELVRACDTYWDEALDHFRRGDFDAWLGRLSAQGQQLAAQGKALRSKHSDSAAALEEFLEAAAPTRSLPILTVNPNALDAGALRSGDSKVATISIVNSGRGYLFGTVQADQPWIQAHPARFGSLPGVAQKIDVQVNTTGLSGTELGVDYSGAITVLSNRGQQTISVRAKVVDEPQARLDPARVDLGKIGWGKLARGQVTVANSGGGTLQGILAPGVPWIAVDPASQRFALHKGQSLPIAFTVDTKQLPRRGQHTGRIQVQTQGRGSPTAIIAVEVGVPYLLDPQQPATAVSRAADLVGPCDAAWDQGLHWLKTGRIEAFLRFVDDATIAQIAADARRQADPSIGLELILRAAGAKAPQKWRSNAGDVLGQLGYGPFPKLGRKPPVVSLLIENTSARGYLHGYVAPLVPWLTAPQPRFGCLPGQTAEVKLHANHSAKKGGIFSLGTELFEIVME